MYSKGSPYGHFIPSSMKKGLHKNYATKSLLWILDTSCLHVNSLDLPYSTKKSIILPPHKLTLNHILQLYKHLHKYIYNLGKQIHNLSLYLLSQTQKTQVPRLFSSIKENQMQHLKPKCCQIHDFFFYLFLHLKSLTLQK